MKLFLSFLDEFVLYSIVYDIIICFFWVGVVEGFYGYEVKLFVFRYEVSYFILIGNSEMWWDKFMLWVILIFIVC